jgi:hypothetical protein
MAEIDLEKERDYHSVLDAMVSDCTAFLKGNAALQGREWPLEVYAEAIVYLACYSASLRSRHGFSIAGWNTFRASVENRMLAIQPNSLPKIDEGEKFVSYSSGYFPYLESREALARPRAERSTELADALLYDVKGPDASRDLFRKFFDQLVVRGRDQVLFKVWLSFEA